MPPIPESLAQQRVALIHVLAGINSDIARMKSRDTTKMTPDQLARHNRAVGIGTAARYTAQAHLSELKEKIKAENIRNQAAQRAADAERKRAAAVQA